MAEPWWKSAVVYQIYPRSFADANGDGIGDLAGIESKLDYLVELGVDVIWLSPVYRSPWDDGGYDISDYQDVDPTFGTLADFDRLLASVHERGLKLVMDLVVNHTSDEHPWFVASRSSRDDPRRDWYWWRPPRFGMTPGAPGAEPTNWASFFSGPTWELDERTGEYYLHLFSRKQPDLNWENPEVRQAVYAMMRWWLDRGVDGFRMDVINMISKDAALPDGPALGTVPYGDGSAYYIDGPRIHEFLSEMHRAVLTDADLLSVGEMPGVTVDEARLFTDPARAEVDMVFQFEHVGLDQTASKWDMHPLDLRDLKTSFGRWQAGLADVGWNSLYWDNHDQPRIVSRWGDGSPTSAKTLGTLLHLHRGTPYVYQGEELGMTNYPWSGVAEFRDIESVNHYADAVARGADPRAGAGRVAGGQPGQRAHADAVGRLSQRRVQLRHAVAAGQPEPHRDQRGRPAEGPGLGAGALQAADRAAARRAGGRARRLHHAAAGGPPGVRVHPPAGVDRAAGALQRVRLAGRGRAARAGAVGLGRAAARHARHAGDGHAAALGVTGAAARRRLTAAHRLTAPRRGTD